MKQKINVFWLVIWFVIAVVAYIFKPNPANKLLKEQKKNLTEKLEVQKSKFDSINKLRVKDSLVYAEQITEKKLELDTLNERLENAKSKRYDSNKARNIYFDSSIDERINELTDNAKNDDIQR